jgi:hypothetical protein
MNHPSSRNIGSYFIIDSLGTKNHKNTVRLDSYTETTDGKLRANVTLHHLPSPMNKRSRYIQVNPEKLVPTETVNGF